MAGSGVGGGGVCGGGATGLRPRFRKATDLQFSAVSAL
jgi:hypothetical protein